MTKKDTQQLATVRPDQYALNLDDTVVVEIGIFAGIAGDDIR